MMPFYGQKVNNRTEVRKGDLLLAEPFMKDPNFSRSVILVCENDVENGSFGLIINQVTDMMLSHVLEDFGQDGQLYTGGPVERDTLHFLHAEENIEGAVPIRDGIYWGGNPEQLRLMMDDDSPQTRFYLGYSGWDEQQLKDEIKQEAWIISEHNLHQVLSFSAENMWRDTLRQMGGWYKAVSNFPKDPMLN